MRERFGRLARMKGETRNAGDWFETVEEVAEAPAEEMPTEDVAEAVAEPTEEATEETVAPETEAEKTEE